ncbi:hypothetical protein [Hymenobacter negativus]|uniref:Secreted protein n=1 Tax=Hymenobacter negativus TaxID=2795026 RepID=A0ABS3Q9K0_9BACT|nr:hypothetical protein [Hymenobacter negativus]MBO2007822.1 hypothetical protein [Hymenobacter negativus]
MRLLSVLVLLSAPSGAALAQTNCPPPTLQVLRNNEEVPATGAPLAPHATLRISPSSACSGTRYQCTGVELTLLRGTRPLTPTRTVRRPQVDLTAWLPEARPGDRLYVFVPYKNLLVLAANGSTTPYPLPETNPSKSRGLDLATDDVKGISFTWVVR